MPIYRTVSDRGLWKKYNRENVQHFHKPHYIDNERGKPMVTYSRLQLGADGRPYSSYNCRQSNPNIPRHVEEHNRRLSQDNQTFEFGQTRGRFSAKSAPGSRSTTPTRVKQRDRVNQQLIDSRPQTSASQYSALPPSGAAQNNFSSSAALDDDDRLSFESRSLTAFSNFSGGGGRDSGMDGSSYLPGGSALGGYRYPYANEPQLARGSGDRGTGDRPNPFEQGGEIAREANAVVKTFLQNGAVYANTQPVVQQQQQQQQQHRQQFAAYSSSSYYADSLASSAVSTSATSTFQHQRPGRIADLESPTSPYNASPERHPHQELIDQQQPTYGNIETIGAATGTSSSRVVISELRKQFMQEDTSKPELNKPKPNKYLKTENRWQKQNQTQVPTKTEDRWQKQQNQTQVPTKTEDRWQKQNQAEVPTTTNLPTMVHAVPVTVRDDTSSSSSSSSSDDGESENEPPKHMVLKSPMSPINIPIVREEEKSKKREQIQVEVKVERGRPKERFVVPPPKPKSRSPSSDADKRFLSSKETARSEYRSWEDPNRNKNERNEGRSFGDPAYASFQQMSQFQDPPRKKSGGGFFSSLFKKRDRSKGSRSGGENKRSQYLEDSKTEDDSSSSSSDSDSDAGTVTEERVRTPVVPMPTSPTNKQEQPLPPVPKVEKDSDSDSSSEEDRTLVRKRSMSRPTDLDEAMRQRQQQQQQHHQYNLNDSLDQPIYQNTTEASLDTTQEIDVDAVLGIRDEDDRGHQNEVDRIEWPPPPPEVLSREKTENKNNKNKTPPNKNKPLAEPDFNRHNDNKNRENNNNKRPGFFNFGSKRNKRDEEENYYVNKKEIEKQKVAKKKSDPINDFMDRAGTVIDVVRVAMEKPEGKKKSTTSDSESTTPGSSRNTSLKRVDDRKNGDQMVQRREEYWASRQQQQQRYETTTTTKKVVQQQQQMDKKQYEKIKKSPPPPLELPSPPDHSPKVRIKQQQQHQQHQQQQQQQQQQRRRRDSSPSSTSTSPSSTLKRRVQVQQKQEHEISPPKDTSTRDKSPRFSGFFRRNKNDHSSSEDDKSKKRPKSASYVEKSDRRGPVDVSHLVDEEELRIHRKEVTSNRKEVTSNRKEVTTKSRSHQTLVQAEVERRNRTTSESSKSSSDERHDPRNKSEKSPKRLFRSPMKDDSPDERRRSDTSPESVVAAKKIAAVPNNKDDNTSRSRSHSPPANDRRANKSDLDEARRRSRSASPVNDRDLRRSHSRSPSRSPSESSFERRGRSGGRFSMRPKRGFFSSLTRKKTKDRSHSRGRGRSNNRRRSYSRLPSPSFRSRTPSPGPSHNRSYRSNSRMSTLPRQRSVGSGIAELFGMKPTNTAPRRRSQGPMHFDDRDGLPPPPPSMMMPPQQQQMHMQQQQRYTRQYQSMPRRRPPSQPGLMGMFDLTPRQQQQRARTPPPMMAPHNSYNSGYHPHDRSFDSHDGRRGPPPPRSVTGGIGLMFGAKPNKNRQPPPQVRSMRSFARGHPSHPPPPAPGPMRTMTHAQSSPAIAAKMDHGDSSDTASSGRQTGRRTGRVKRQQTVGLDHANSLHLAPAPKSPLTPTERDAMRDVFIESLKRPPTADVGDGKRRSFTSLGRSDSYRRAKGDEAVDDEDKTGSKTSLPKLMKDNRRRR